MLLPDWGRKFPREIAGLKLGRLAVAHYRQRQGVGQTLLVVAMQKVLEVHACAGGIGLFLHAKNATARAWYERFGFVPLPDQPLQFFLPLATIEAALRI